MSQEELFEILKQQTIEHKLQKKESMLKLKKQKLHDLKTQKLKLSDGLAKHPKPFQPTNSAGNLFLKSQFLFPQPHHDNQKTIGQAWLPTNPNSRLLSSVHPDTIPLPRPVSVKEKLWRPFSSQPEKANMIQLLPFSPKETARSPQKNQIVQDVGNKFIPLKPFLPTRRIFSAFPK